MFMKRILFTISMLVASSLAAAPECDHPLTLSELVDIALENHPSTRQAWWNAQRAAAALGNAEGALYPKVDFVGFVKNGQEYKFINGPQTNFTFVGADVLLSWLLLDAGQRNADICSTKEALLAANWQSDWVLQKVMVRVLENAYATLHAQEVVAAARISVAEAEKMLSVAKELNNAGLNTISDVYTSQSTLSTLKMDLAQQLAQLDIAKGKLAASLGSPACCTIDVAPLDYLPPVQELDTCCLIEMAWQRRSDLMARQARLADSYWRLEKARANCNGSRFSFSGGGGANQYIDDKRGGAQYNVSLKYELPLFEGFKTTYQYRQAYADTQISTEELLELQLDIAMDVLTHSRTLQAVQEMLPEAESNLENAQKAYDAVITKYRAGKERIAEVSNAHKQLVAARVRFSDIKTRFFVSSANLAYATGTLSPSMETRCTKNL